MVFLFIFYLPQVKLENFSLISEDEIRKIIRKSSNASCQLDPIPTWLVKLSGDELVPVLSKMVNLHLSEGNVPDHWKTALSLPLFKKCGLDPFVVKLAEKIVIPQLSTHSATTAPLPENQSSYQEYHSKETALLKAHICYLPAGRSVLQKTVPEVLITHSRTLAAQFFPIRTDLGWQITCLFFSSVEYFVSSFCVEFSPQPFSNLVYACVWHLGNRKSTLRSFAFLCFLGHYLHFTFSAVKKKLLEKTRKLEN